MKKIYATLFALALTTTMMAQGWPANYQGVMLQGFYWDSFNDSQWTNLESQADELAQYFTLVWIPQSGKCNDNGWQSMGYDDYYWFDQNSTFGTESQLRSLITTFKAKGIGTIADVVVNHRNTDGWVTFPKETYNGVTYQMLPTDICANDDGGKTKTWAEANGYSLSTNNDSGEGWDGMRDLDHQSENVQTCVKAYLGFLLGDLGYTGFRYDMVKGFSGSYVGLYNHDAAPQFSVGEYWDGNKNNVENWINATKVNGTIQSAAFDFPFRYTVRDAVNAGSSQPNWAKLDNTSVMADAAYRRYAVTFVENHDTEKRANADQDPIKRDTLAANAYLLAMPGTPCVFFKHWKDCKKDIAQMIAVRQFAGIHNQSEYSKFSGDATHYAVRTKGANSDLLCVVGNVTKYTPTARWIKVAEGYHYRYCPDRVHHRRQRPHGIEHQGGQRLDSDHPHRHDDAEGRPAHRRRRDGHREPHLYHHGLPAYRHHHLCEYRPGRLDERELLVVGRRQQPLAQEQQLARRQGEHHGREERQAMVHQNLHHEHRYRLRELSVQHGQRLAADRGHQQHQRRHVLRNLLGDRGWQEQGECGDHGHRRGHGS